MFNLKAPTHKDILEVGGIKPKVPRPGIRVPSSTSSRYRVKRMRDVRDVPCVRRRARDRSIGRGRSEGLEIRLRLRPKMGSRRPKMGLNSSERTLRTTENSPQVPPW